MTYSINIGTNTESNSIDISDISQFEALLNRLPDNLEGLVNPDDLRDTILSCWSNIAFKETNTTGSTNSYIGIDSGNPSDRDIKLKVLLGKKLNSSNDVLSNQLLSEDTDIYFYNTKSDNIQNSFTKLSFLSGNNSNLFLNAPFIQTKVVTGLTSSFLSMDIANNFGSIDIDSSQDFVSINDINFPKKSNSSSQSLNGKVLTYNSGNLEWGVPTSQLGSNIGITGSTTSLSGNVSVNNYSLELTDSRMVPLQFGDINVGESFGNYSLSEALRRMIYPYQSPTAFLSLLPPFQNGYVEFGTFPNIVVEFTINKRTLPTLPTILTNMNPGNYPPISTSGNQTVIGTASALLLTPIGSFTSNQSVSITVSDGVQTNTFSRSIIGVYPYYYGISNLPPLIQLNTVSNSLVLNPPLLLIPSGFLTKLIDGNFTRTINFIGDGFIYYLYPSFYGPLSDILNSSGDSIFNDFTSAVSIISSNTGFWLNVSYIVYKSNISYSISVPTNFTFVI